MSLIKKILILTSILFSYIIISSINTNCYAALKDYNSFAYMNVDSGKLLRDYDPSLIDYELEKVRNRRFCGWNIYKLNTNVRATFITEALFSYKNEGTTPITYTLNITRETTSKTSVSATNSIEIKVGENGKEFKSGFSDELKISSDYTLTELVKEQQNLQIVVDPNTICIGYIEGQGYFTNGVACYYFWWFENQIGAFEYFTITESYLKIEKLSL